MFYNERQRTPEEIERDRQFQVTREYHKKLSRGFTDNIIRKTLQEKGCNVGLVGTGIVSECSQLLVEDNGIVYRIDVKVERDDL